LHTAHPALRRKGRREDCTEEGLLVRRKGCRGRVAGERVVVRAHNPSCGEEEGILK